MKGIGEDNEKARNAGEAGAKPESNRPFWGPVAGQPLRGRTFWQFVSASGRDDPLVDFASGLVCFLQRLASASSF